LGTFLAAHSDKTSSAIKPNRSETYQFFPCPRARGTATPNEKGLLSVMKGDAAEFRRNYGAALKEQKVVR
jgi:hypothetical protein